MNIGEEIRRLRRSRNMTQSDLAEKTGLDRSYISHLERSNKRGSLDTLKIIVNALGMDLKVEITPKEKRPLD